MLKCNGFDFPKNNIHNFIQDLTFLSPFLVKLKGLERNKELVTDLVEDLLGSDIISKKEISKLKNDNPARSLDPTLVMDLRHKQARNTPDIQCEEQCTSKYSGRNQENQVVRSSVKDLKTIDKEIAMTRRELKRLNNQMSENEDFLSTSILAIEEERKKILDATAPVHFNETEIKKYFEIHLDSLEDKIKADKLNSDMPNKMWTPIQIECPPVINVETSQKVSHYNQLKLELDFEELSILELFEIDPICVMGKPVEQVSFRDKIKNQYEPDSTTASQNSELNKREPLNCRGNSLSSRETIIARAALEKWKKYAREIKIKKMQDKMKNKALNCLLKKVFTTWHLHTKHVKSIKNARICQTSKVKLEHSQTHSFNDIEGSSECTTEQLFKEKKTTEENEIDNSKNNQGNTSEDCFLTKRMKICSKNNNTTKCAISSKSSDNDCDTKETDYKNKTQAPKNIDITSYIHRKIVTPECVGLPSARKNPKLQDTKPNTTKNKGKGCHKSLINLSTNSEQFYFRYAAQERIISQQLAVIEKQKQIILDLQAENLENKSALQKITIDSQLKIANAMQENRNKCHTNTVKAEKAAHVKNQCNEDKSLELTSRMLSRHEYCKELAEKTKNRKIRIEEEKAKVKAELEEREKIEQDEKKKQRLKQIRLEQILAEKSSKLNFAKKQRIDELTKTAVHHYNRTLLRKVFDKLKEARLETQLQTNQCKNMLEKKLLKRSFLCLKKYTNESLNMKYEEADRFHKDRLIERYWCYWRQLHHEYKIKVQVSVDMFELSLQRRMFHRWQDYVAEQYKLNCYKTELADRLYSRKLLQNCLKKWRELPQTMLAEREREKRLRAWRRAVQEIIPDFKPVQVEPP